ncbi:LuxR C-terminal-related transcriptional regulator [Aquabacterium sp.]|uniref:LuxR C-terminal-related transcriptional regulator n=1 Tax=Aquabacterium sp. TaxID=1872578 RepID=UPI002BC329D9|nr:LuxR C-terminal-related transcriptional regulator [Aquabacterium sp.]HSW03327.1 LuxR C-terminal-related transcriptional regulator [Aquabacterium sp.]
MPRIIVVSSSPLHAGGVAAALQGVEGWVVQIGRADEPADAWVLTGEELQLRGAQGASGLLAADADAPRLRAAVAAVLQGLSVREAPWLGSSNEHEPLTPRELEVFELLGKGLSNRDIGGVLGISAHTAKFHVGQILAKTGAATRAEAVSEGLRCGLIGL